MTVCKMGEEAKRKQGNRKNEGEKKEGKRN